MGSGLSTAGNAGYSSLSRYPTPASVMRYRGRMGLASNFWRATLGCERRPIRP